MKNLLLALLVLAPLTASASATDEACESLANFAKGAAVARDDGHSLEAALGVIKGEDETANSARGTIRRVYSIPTLSPDEVKEFYLLRCTERP